MKKTNKVIIICSGNLEIDAPIYIDEGGHTYAKINAQFFSTDILTYLKCEIREQSPG